MTKLSVIHSIVALTLGLAAPRHLCAIGYDFESCAPLIAKVREASRQELESPELQNAMSKITASQRATMAERSARLAIIQYTEENVEAAADKITAVTEVYTKKLQAGMQKLHSEEEKARMLADLEEDNDLYISDSDLVKALKGGTEGEQTNALRWHSLEDAIVDQLIAEFLDMDKSENPQRTQPNQIESFDQLPTASTRTLFPTIESKNDLEVAAAILSVVGEMRILSKFRLAFHQDLVEAVPLDQHLTDFAKSGGAAELYQALLDGVAHETQLTEPSESVLDRMAADGLNIQEFHSVISEVTKSTSTGYDRLKILETGHEALAKNTLPRFLKADLERHLKFLEEFKLPVDQFSTVYINRLAAIAKKLATPTTP